MKKIFFVPVLALLMTACTTTTTTDTSNNGEVPDHAIRDSVRDPLIVQPETENIPEGMEIKKDSVIVPDGSMPPPSR